MGIEQRLQRIEEKLNIDTGLTVIEILDFSGPLPPDELVNGILIKHVAYEGVNDGYQTAN